MGIEEMLLTRAQEKGLKMGMEKDMKEGIKEGMEKGKTEALEIAGAEVIRNARVKGFEIELIAELVGISVPEVQKIMDKFGLK